MSNYTWLTDEWVVGLSCCSLSGKYTTNQCLGIYVYIVFSSLFYNLPFYLYVPYIFPVMENILYNNFIPHRLTSFIHVYITYIFICMYVCMYMIMYMGHLLFTIVLCYFSLFFCVRFCLMYSWDRLSTPITL